MSAPAQDATDFECADLDAEEDLPTDGPERALLCEPPAGLLAGTAAGRPRLKALRAGAGWRALETRKQRHKWKGVRDRRFSGTPERRTRDYHEFDPFTGRRLREYDDDYNSDEDDDEGDEGAVFVGMGFGGRYGGFGGGGW